MCLPFCPLYSSLCGSCGSMAMDISMKNGSDIWHALTSAVIAEICVYRYIYIYKYIDCRLWTVVLAESDLTQLQGKRCCMTHRKCCDNKTSDKRHWIREGEKGGGWKRKRRRKQTAIGLCRSKEPEAYPDAASDQVVKMRWTRERDREKRGEGERRRRG